MDFAVQGIDHIVLRSANVTTMLRFYREVLGATLERELPQQGLYQLRVGASLIDIVDTAAELGRRAGAAPNRKAPNMDHFCLLISPWRESSMHAWLRRHGVAFSSTEQRYGAQGFGSSLYIADPDGNTIELKAAAIGKR